MAAKGLVFVLCCLADLFVLRTVWTGRQTGDGQFRRGYFERFGGEVGLAMDDDVKPLFKPSFLLTDEGELAAQPGMIAVAPLIPGTVYELNSDSALSPYVVIGNAAPIGPFEGTLEPLPGEARLAETRTLSLQGNQLALVDWDAARSWAEDSARLAALRDHCAVGEGAIRLKVSAGDDGLEIRLGRCVLNDGLGSSRRGARMLASISGPAWNRIARRPEWVTERKIVWPVVGAVLGKVAALWWSLGPVSAVAASTVLALASFRLPVPATLTWPLLLVVGAAAAILRGAAISVRKLPPRFRLPVILLGVLFVGWIAWPIVMQQPATGPNWGISGGQSPCIVVGYSTVEDQGLRREHGGTRWILNERCGPCRDNTSSLSFGGATIEWARDAFCGTSPSYGIDGHVIFLGGANDDLLTGVGSMARLFVVSRQGIEAWRNIQNSAPAASLARLDEQEEALGGLARCALARGAQFLFLHDFVVTDLVAGRSPDRAAMLKGRREAVERAGGTFVDLFDTFGDEAGVWWFNDFVHVSRIAHERIAQLACERLQPVSRRISSWDRPNFKSVSAHVLGKDRLASDGRE